MTENKQSPLTAADMRALWEQGEPLAEIARRAYARNNRMRRAQVRAIVFDGATL